MLKHPPISMLYATLDPGERHLHSFAGQSVEWSEDRAFLGLGAVKGYIPFPTTIIFYYRGHLTDRRMILEFPKDSNSLIIWQLLLSTVGALSGGRIAEFAHRMNDEVGESRKMQREMAETAKYFSLPYSDINTIWVKGRVYCWATIHGDHTGLGVPFVPRYIDASGKAHQSSPWKGGINNAPPEVTDFIEIISPFCKVYWDHSWSSIKGTV
jgi:hypothetical protein